MAAGSNSSVPATELCGDAVAAQVPLAVCSSSRSRSNFICWDYRGQLCVKACRPTKCLL